jgi:pyruvate-formate lyase-activating enzyme
MAAEPRIEFFRHMDAANIDLKGFTEGFYKNLCSGKLAPVLETLEYLKNETNVWFEITTLLIPGENDSPAEIEAESAWVMDRLGPDVPLYLRAQEQARDRGWPHRGRRRDGTAGIVTSRSSCSGAPAVRAASAWSNADMVSTAVVTKATPA